MGLELLLEDEVMASTGVEEESIQFSQVNSIIDKIEHQVIPEVNDEAQVVRRGRGRPTMEESAAKAGLTSSPELDMNELNTEVENMLEGNADNNAINLKRLKVGGYIAFYKGMRDKVFWKHFSKLEDTQVAKDKFARSQTADLNRRILMLEYIYRALSSRLGEQM